MCPSPELLDPRHCVVNNLHKTARAVGRVYAEAMRPTGLTRPQFALLGHLDNASPDTPLADDAKASEEKGAALTISELARRLVMDRTTLTRNLRPLERAGLVTRGPAPDDGRVRLVSITPAGRAKLDDARGYWRQAQARVLERFGEAAWRDLETTLRELRQRVR